MPREDSGKMANTTGVHETRLEDRLYRWILLKSMNIERKQKSKEELERIESWRVETTHSVHGHKESGVLKKRRR